MTLSVLDLFCGAGGSSTGLTEAGFTVEHASNHWDLAIEVHQLNHPDADHSCVDISRTDPRYYPSTDVLWASPSCTNHSVARGVKRWTGQADLFGEDGPDPAAERSRATMWDVPRFTEAMIMRGRPYKAIIVENVVDAVKWMYWRPWLATMEAAGYEHQVVYLNSAFAHGKDYVGAPQYRDRIYVVFWLRGATRPDLDIRPPGWCASCQAQVAAIQTWKRPFEAPWGRYRAQYVYRCPTCHHEVEPAALPAAVAIDWSDLGGRIGDRTRPLAKATRERIRAGLARYGRPTMTPAGGTWNDDARPVDEPMRARTTRETEGIACPPLGVPVGGNTFERAPGTRVWTVDGPRPVVTASGEANALVCPPMVVPVEARDGLRPRLAAEPMRTQTARLENALVTGPPLPEPFLAMLRRNNRPTAVSEPLDTLVAASQHHGLVVPPGLVMRNNSSKGDGAEMCTPLGEPVRTLTTAGHQSLITWPDAILAAYYSNGTCSHITTPVPTQSTRDRFALITRTPDQVGDDEIDSCTFRMLTPAEILAAMAFPADYAMRGVKRDRVRMAGNAVTPPAARLIGERVLAALATS